jgi:pyrroloquinoline-quinone synthase
MTALELDCAMADMLSERRLLDHPFYRRWERGEVSIDELASYAAQYRYFEEYLPTFLTKLMAGLPEGTARDLVAANRADELGDPVAHVELFQRFAEAVGAPTATASPATQGLLATYDELLDRSPLAALAGFAAYECQASEIARRKADGLRRDHGLDEHGVSFWEHHATTDRQHSEWIHRALDESPQTPGELAPFIRQAADAWWAFLDEREALVPTDR